MSPEAPKQLPKPTRPGEIVKMPTKEELEDFIAGHSGPVTVQFNQELGLFVRVRPKPDALSPNTKP